MYRTDFGKDLRKEMFLKSKESATFRRFHSGRRAACYHVNSRCFGSGEAAKEQLVRCLGKPSVYLNDNEIPNWGV